MNPEGFLLRARIKQEVPIVVSGGTYTLGITDMDRTIESNGISIYRIDYEEGEDNRSRTLIIRL
jgi:hypothetical protein